MQVALSPGFVEPYNYALNGAYDPYGGASATGFGKYMNLYSKCYVLGARVTLKYAIGSASDLTPANGITMIGITITTNTTTLVSAVRALTTGMTQYRMTGASPDSAVLSLGVDIAKFVDKPSILDDPTYFCTSAVNPADIVYCHLWAEAFGTGTTALVGLAEIEMDCVFTDPIPFS
jgi:hypothetical protein